MTATWDIGIDLDGVLYPFDQEAAAEARRLNLGTIPAHPTAWTWHFYRAWGITDEQFADMYTHSVRAGRLLWTGTPYPGTRDGWRALLAAGHRLHALTDRRPAGAEADAEAATRHWLATHGLHPSTLTITPDKTRVLEHAQHPHRVAFLEDLPRNQQALLAAGVPTWLIDRPWNIHAPASRVSDLPAFARTVQSLAHRH